MSVWLRAHGFTAFLALACAALGAQVLVLSRENHTLKTARAAETNAALYQPGDAFFSFELRAGDGALRPVQFGERAPRTLLFVTAEACPICPQIVPRWQEIAPHFLAAGARVLGVRLDRVDAEAEPWIAGVPLEVFADLTRVPLSKLRTLPLTVLVDGAGVVEWVHYGTLSDARLAELMAYL